MRRIAGLVGLVLLSSGLSLGLCELVFRLLVPPASHHLMYAPSDDPGLAVELRAGADFVFEGVPVRIPPTRVIISEQGLRDDPVLVPAPSGVRRLLCVGDSTTFGWGVEQAQTFCSRLEQHLGDDWETVNLGVPGYGTPQEVRRLEGIGLAMDPDVVLVLYDPNDVRPPLKWGGDGVAAWWIRHSALVRWVRLRIARSRPDDTGWDGAAAVREAFARLATLSKKHDFAVLVMVPDPKEQEPLTAHLDALGLAWASALDPLKDSPTLRIPGDGHPTSEGHAKLAEHFFTTLQSRGLVP